MSDFNQDLERILAADYLDGLQQLPVSEVRVRRNSCLELEEALSILRRLVQGRLDIVHADLKRRAGSLSTDLSDVVDHLPEILTEGGHRSEVRRRLRMNLPPDVNFRKLTADLERIIDVNTTAGHMGMGNDEVRTIAESLEELERRVSSQRRSLHERIDALQAEIVRRYKSGEATTDDLLE